MIKKSIATLLDDGIHTGRQPTHTDVQELAFSGCRALLALGLEDEPNRLLTRSMEASWSRSFGMEHRSVAVHPCTPEPGDVERVLAAIEDSPRPVYVHSPGGERAIAFLIIRRALATGETAPQAHLWMARRGLRLENTDLYRFAVREVMRRQASEPEPLVGEGYQRGRSFSGKKKATPAG